jgi:hypothetical protein
MELGLGVDDIAAMKAHLSFCGTTNYRQQSMGWGDALDF